MSESGRRPTEAILRIAALKRFLYDPSTGVFTYKVRTRASSEGAIAGSRAVGATSHLLVRLPQPELRQRLNFT